MTQQSREFTPSIDSPGASARRTSRFTGWHMLAILVAFFGVVIVVNVIMARLATSTFDGEVVTNSYDASQKFNLWLDEAKAEKALGWKADVSRHDDRLAIVMTDRDGKPLQGAHVAIVAERPFDAAASHDLVASESAPGTYEAALTQSGLARGRWQLRMTVSANGHVWHKVEELAGTGPALGQ